MHLACEGGSNLWTGYVAGPGASSFSGALLYRSVWPTFMDSPGLLGSCPQLQCDKGTAGPFLLGDVPCHHSGISFLHAHPNLNVCNCRAAPGQTSRA